MVNACKHRYGLPWPRAILFETRGFANTSAESNKEEETVMMLQDYGYALVFAGGDTIVIHCPALTQVPYFAKWADEHFLLTCDGCGWMIWPSQPDFVKDS